MKVAIGILSSLVLMGLVACGPQQEVNPAVNFMELRKQEPLSESYNLNYQYTDSGYVRMRLLAGRAREYLDSEGQRTEYIQADSSVRIEFYEADGTLRSKLTSQTARLYEGKGLADARGNVVVVNREGDRLETEQLFWFRQRKQLATGGFVKITTATEIIFGDSLVARDDFATYKIYKLRGTIRLKEG